MFSETTAGIAFGCIGITFVLIHSKPIMWFRKAFLDAIKPAISPVLYSWLFDGLGCFHCMGFWVGLIGGFIFNMGWYAVPFGACISFINFSLQVMFKRWGITL